MPSFSSAVLPAPRGPLSSWVIRRVRHPRLATEPPAVAAGSGWSDDLQLALYVSHHLHLGLHLGAWARESRGDDLEWASDLIGLRRRMEDEFLRAIGPDAVCRLDEVDATGCRAMTSSGAVLDRISALLDADDSPSVSTFLQHHGTLDQYRDAVTARAAYQLTEGDFHTFAIPRLRGRAKQLLAAIQAGEYGADAPDREIHAALFARTMRGLGLDDRPYALVDQQRAAALAISNLISTFGLDAARRGALVGHLAVFEMTSVTPMGRYAAGLRRLGATDDTCRFYDVHVLADAEHEHLAAEMVTALVDDEPGLAPDVLFGAAAALVVERWYAHDLMSRWRGENRSRSLADVHRLAV